MNHRKALAAFLKEAKAAGRPVDVMPVRRGVIVACAGRFIMPLGCRTARNLKPMLDGSRLSALTPR